MRHGRDDPPHPPPPSGPSVTELLARVAAERGIDFEPTPPAVVEALPGLVEVVDHLAERLHDPQERRWLAAALAALSHRAQLSALAEPHDADPQMTEERPAGTGGVAVAVVTSPLGVLAGRRRDGIPRWVFPGGAIEHGETPAEAAVRECAEETGLHVVPGRVIGCRAHPVTGEVLTYVACTPSDGLAAHAAAPDELVEVRWLNHAQVQEVMPELYGAVRDHLDRQTDRAR